MGAPREVVRVGLDSLRDVTTLLQRIRRTHPTAGLYDAAEVQWWWADPAPTTDELAQLYWFDDHERPAAAVVITDWGRGAQLDPIVLPGASPDWVAHVVRRGLAHAAELGIDGFTLEVGRDDPELRAVLDELGFAIADEGLVEAWSTADARPPVSPLHAGYRLSSRDRELSRSHHMNGRRRRVPDIESRLRQTSLYRPDLDLVVYDDHDEAAGYGLCWYDPVTAVGVVEPMRTEAAHQRRGLARHVLTAGLDRLAAAGAERVKICYEPSNPASGHLYRSVGFAPHRRTDVFARPTTGGAAETARPER